MKIKVDQLIFFSIIFHVLSTQSVLTYLFFDLFGVWEVKSYLHPISLVILISSFSLKIKYLKVRYEDILVFIYAIILLILMLFNINSFFSFYMAIREVFFIFILTYLLSQYHFSLSQYKIFRNLLVILIIINLGLTALTYILGAEGFMKLIVGYYAWGVDEVTKFQISNFLATYWRSPAGVGSSAGTAYFALFSYFIFDLKSKQGFIKFLALALILSTFTRSALLCLVIYEFLKFLSYKKNIVLIQKYSDIIIGFLIIFVVIFSQLSLFNIESVIIRIDVWLTEISVDYNLFYGGNLGNVGGAIRGDGHEAILDSYWLFLLYATGLIGIIIWFIFFYEKSKISKRKFFFVIGIVCSGFFIHLTQAIPFLVMFPLVFAHYDKLTTET